MLCFGSYVQKYDSGARPRSGRASFRPPPRAWRTLILIYNMMVISLESALGVGVLLRYTDLLCQLPVVQRPPLARGAACARRSSVVVLGRSVGSGSTSPVSFQLRYGA
jgi:hypothetical protein